MSSPKREVRKRSQARVPSGYAAVLADVKQLIAESRHRALATVNRELVCLYWHIGRDLTFVGDEYAITVVNDTSYIDLLFFHRRLQCLLSVDLKIGQFKPEYVGKSQFYCAALDEQVKLAHENPSIGLVLCKTADRPKSARP